MKENNQLTKRERTDLAKRLKSENCIIKKQANTELIDKLDKLIWKEIYHKYNQYPEYFEDLYNSAVVKILEYSGSYNPEFTLSTYFSFTIKGALFDFMAKFIRNSTIHYMHAEKKIKNAVNQLKMKNEEVSISKVSEITGLNEKTIKNAMAFTFRRADNKSQYDDSYVLFDNTLIADVSIEDDYIRQETSVLLRKSLCELEPQMRAVVILKSNNMSVKSISKKLNISEFKVHALYDKGIEKLRSYFHDTELLNSNIRLINFENNSMKLQNECDCNNSKTSWEDIVSLKSENVISFAL